MVAHLTGEANPNWKGGRTVASNGYVLIRMPGHHLADCRGYVYEHRYVAEQMLGRRLRPGEEVHHGPGGTQDNRPENLEVKNSHAEHFLEHRKRTDLQLPGEPNTVVRCECGCGGELNHYDSQGRPRKFISGHNSRASATGQFGG